MAQMSLVLLMEWQLEQSEVVEVGLLARPGLELSQPVAVGDFLVVDPVEPVVRA